MDPDKADDWAELAGARVADAVHGPARTSDTTVREAPVRALAALFDDGLDDVAPGHAIPPLWHWAALSAWPALRSLGADGHPSTAGTLPGLGPARRMFAGGSVVEHRPLLAGQRATRSERLVCATPKRGRSGSFLLTEVSIELHAAGELAVEERQRLVYRPLPTGTAPQSRHGLEAGALVPQLLERVSDGWLFRTDPSVLMRFSAATSNGHRVHYDLGYAVDVEGYPGLLVHGPLIAMSLLQVARREGVDVAGARIQHRSHAPLFCGQEALIQRAAGGAGSTIQLRSGSGVHAELVIEVRD